MKNQITRILVSMILLCLFSVEFCKAQTNDAFAPTVIDFYNSRKFYRVLDKKKFEFTGSPYADSNFYKGYIITSDSSIYHGIYLRYNNYKDVMEFKKEENEIYEIPNALPVLQMKFNGAIFEKKMYQLKGISKSGFFRRVTNGRTSLFCQQRIILEKAKMASLYNASKLPNFKQTALKWYLQMDKNKELVSFSNKKELLSILSDEENKLSTFIKKNKLKIRREDDMVEIVNYYNVIAR